MVDLLDNGVAEIRSARGKRASPESKHLGKDGPTIIASSFRSFVALLNHTLHVINNHRQREATK